MSSFPVGCPRLPDGPGGDRVQAAGIALPVGPIAGLRRSLRSHPEECRPGGKYEAQETCEHCVLLATAAHEAFSLHRMLQGLALRSRYRIGSNRCLDKGLQPAFGIGLSNAADVAYGVNRVGSAMSQYCPLYLQQMP